MEPQTDPHDAPMDGLTVSEQLLLLCWDGDRGRASTACAASLPAGLGGAAVIDALAADVIAIEDGELQLQRAASEALLQPLTDEVGRERRKPLTVEKLVPRIGNARQLNLVRERLVQRGVLRAEERHILGLFPSTRHHLADPAAQEATRAPVRALLTGELDPTNAHPDHVLLAALAGSVDVIPVLVTDRGQRKEAKARAEAFAEGEGVPDAVSTVIAEAQAAMVATMAAITAATSASAATSSGSSGSC